MHLIGFIKKKIALFDSTFRDSKTQERRWICNIPLLRYRQYGRRHANHWAPPQKALKTDNTYTFEMWQDSKFRQVHLQTKI
jgi:hypothetical protein